MNDDKTCTEYNSVLHLRCDRLAGHDGTHIQFDSNGTHAWGWGGILYAS